MKEYREGLIKILDCFIIIYEEIEKINKKKNKK